MKLKERVLKLIREPSTWTGVASFLGGAAIFGIGEEQWSDILGGLMMSLGTIASVVLDPADKDAE